MPAELAHYAIAELFGMSLNRCTNIAKARPGLSCFDAEHQAFIGHIDQPLGFDRRFTCKEHAACVTMPTIQQRRHINVENVTVFENFGPRNTMADHMIDRDAA